MAKSNRYGLNFAENGVVLVPFISWNGTVETF